MVSDDDLVCRFDGNSVSLELTNSSDKPAKLEFECVYNLEDGTQHTTLGSTSLLSGQSFSTNAEETKAKVLGVAAKSLFEAV